MADFTKKSGANRQLCFGQYAGAIPATPVAVYLRNTGDTLDGKTAQIKSNEMLPGRSKTKPKPGTASNGGGVSFELAPLSFDKLLAALFMANWVQDGTDTKIATLTPSNIKKNFWILKYFSEPDKPLWQLYTGLVVDSLDLNYVIDDIVKGTFNFVGANDPALVTANPVSGLTFPTAGTTEAFTSRIGYLKVDDVDCTYAKEFKFSIKNNYATLAALFQAVSDAKEKDFDVAGNLTAYFTDEVMYNKAQSGADIKFSIEVSNAAGDKYLFEFAVTTLDPGAKSTAASGKDEITPSYAFTASGATMVKLTRTLASAVAVYSLTYDGNTSTGGTVPAVVTKNEAGAQLYASANSGTLVKTGKVFSGWNSLATGLGVDYAVGAPIVIEAATTLYAKWTDA